MSHTGYHTYQPINHLLAMGDNKLKSICRHDDGTAHSARLELQERQQRGQEYLVIGNCLHKHANGQCAGHILPVEPQRDENGYYAHEGIPDFGEDGEAMANWIYEQQLITAVSFLFDEPQDSEPFDSFFNKDGTNISSWQPTPPDEGYFMLCIVDTDDGPACWWVKHKTDIQVLSIPMANLKQTA